MAALRDMALNLMIKRAAAAAAETTLPPATGSNPRLSEAQLHDFCRTAMENYVKQRRMARIAGAGLAGVAAVTLVGFGIHRLDSSTARDQ